MKPVYIIADSVISSLGFDTQQNYNAIMQQQSGIQQHTKLEIYPEKFWASMIDAELFQQKFQQNFEKETYTFFEKIAIQAIINTNENTRIDLSKSNVLFVLSTTKGNIAALSIDDEKVYLQNTAKKIAQYFQNSNSPIVVDQACISGIAALNFATYFIEENKFDFVVVVGADVVSSFVVNGFFALNAVSNALCKPFDKNRSGINLGESAGAIILANASFASSLQLSAGNTSNDANHISGPSRTGEELAWCIAETMKDAGLDASQIGFVSAHGTATIFNDEMESKAIEQNNLSAIPTFSLKGYFGHTLGAAGIIETIISAQALKENSIPTSIGYEENGVTGTVNITKENQHKEINNFIKTGAGFGGCNACLIVKKIAI